MHLLNQARTERTVVSSDELFADKVFRTSFFEIRQGQRRKHQQRDVCHLRLVAFELATERGVGSGDNKGSLEVTRAHRTRQVHDHIGKFIGISHGGRFAFFAVSSRFISFGIGGGLLYLWLISGLPWWRAPPRRRLQPLPP